MTRFDLPEVRDFAANLDARMTRCDHGEGLECDTLDATLRGIAAALLRVTWREFASGDGQSSPVR